MEEMKMKKMLVLVSVLLLSSAAFAETWDLDLDFETALTNPNGAWTYGYVDGNGFYQFGGLVYDRDVDPVNGSMRIAWRDGDNWDNKGNIQKILEGEANFEAWTSYRYGGEMCSGPGAEGGKTAIRWTCPADGAYGISAMWQGLSTKGEGTTVDVTLEQNGAVFFADNVAGFIGRPGEDGWGAKPEVSYATILNLLAGDTIDITIAGGADGIGADCTNMDLTIVPEPITMALLGLGGMAMVRRRR